VRWDGCVSKPAGVASAAEGFAGVAKVSLGWAQPLTPEKALVNTKIGRAALAPINRHLRQPAETRASRRRAPVPATEG
jgi:hypothetical protein